MRTSRLDTASSALVGSRAWLELDTANTMIEGEPAWLDTAICVLVCAPAGWIQPLVCFYVHQQAGYSQWLVCMLTSRLDTASSALVGSRAWLELDTASTILVCEPAWLDTAIGVLVGAPAGWIQPEACL